MDPINSLSNRSVLFVSTFLNNLFSGRKISAGLLLSCSFISGCSSLDFLESKDTASINPNKLSTYVDSQENVYGGLVKLAALSGDPATTDEWKQFILAGVQYANQRCESYLDETGGAGLDRNLIHDLQRQYVEKLSANQYTNRTGAFNALQGYISLCSPGNIQALSGGSVRVAQPGQSQDGGMNLVPYVLRMP